MPMEFPGDWSDLQTDGAQPLKSVKVTPLPATTSGDVEELLAHRLAFDPLTLEQVASNYVQAKRDAAHLRAIMNYSGPSLELNRQLVILEDEIKLLAQLGKALFKADQLKAAARWILSDDLHGTYGAEFRNEIDDVAHSFSVNAEHAARLLAVLEEA